MFETGEKAKNTSPEDKVYLAPENINGIKFYCEWNDNYGGYVLVFPQIAEAKENAGVLYQEGDWIIKITKNSAEVREIFDEVKKIATNVKNVSDLFSSVNAYLAQRK